MTMSASTSSTSYEERSRSDSESGASLSREGQAAHATSPTASVSHAAQGVPEERTQYCDVYIPGIVRPLHVELAAGVESTTVEAMRELVLHALDAQRQAAPQDVTTAAAPPSRYVRLMFRGKELRRPGLSLAQYGVVSGSAVHALVTSVQPRNQSAHHGTGSSLVPLASRNMQDAREVITTALNALWPSAEAAAAVPAANVPPSTAADAAAGGGGSTRSSLYAAGGAAGGAAAVSRAQLTNSELLHLLQQERMLRSQAVPLPRPAQQAAGETTQTPVPGRPHSEVHVLSAQPPTGGAAAAVGGGSGGGARAGEAMSGSATAAGGEAGDDGLEQMPAVVQGHTTMLLGQAFVAGFLLGPLCYVLPIVSPMGRAGLMLGCIANLIMFWVTYSESYV